MSFLTSCRQCRAEGDSEPGSSAQRKAGPHAEPGLSCSPRREMAMRTWRRTRVHAVSPRTGKAGGAHRIGLGSAQAGGTAPFR